MALSIATTGYIMETGKVVMDGPADKLLRDEDVLRQLGRAPASGHD